MKKISGVSNFSPKSMKNPTKFSNSQRIPQMHRKKKQRKSRRNKQTEDP